MKYDELIDKAIDIFQVIVAIIGLVATILVLGSCQRITRQDGALYLEWEEIVIDSCEYIVPKTYTHAIIHKPNCKNKEGHKQ